MSRNRWTILFALFAARASVGFQFQTVASSTHVLRRDLGVGLEQIGVLIGVYFLTGLFLALPAGVIGARFGARTTVLAGLALMVAGSLAGAFSEVWSVHLAARMVAGAGGVLVSVLMTKMVTDWFVGADTATAMGIFVNSWPVGLAIALLAVPPLADATGLRGVFLVSAALCAAGFALVALVYRDPPQPAAPSPAVAQPQAQVWPRGATFWLVVLAAMVWGWFNAGFAQIFGFGPAMLAERGMSAVAAGSVVSIVLWLSILSVPAGGIIADRTGAPRLIIALSATIGAILVLVASNASQPALAFAALGLVIGLPAGPIMALPSLVLRPAERAVGMGVFYTIFYLLMLLGPVAAGYLARSAGTAAAAFQSGALGIAMGVVCFAAFLLGLRRHAGPRA
ncbi:MAG: MFS transporter [Beijerinckiaceae bacterium]